MSMRKSLIGLCDSAQGIEKNDEGYKVIQMRPNAGDLVYTASGTQLVVGAAENFDVWMSSSKVALINTLLSGTNAAQPLSDAQVAHCTRVMSEAHALERFGLGFS